MTKSTCTIALIALSCACARATISFNLNAADLRTAGGASLMPQSGLVLLVADTLNNGFASQLTAGASLNVGSFLSGDDLVLFRSDLSVSGQDGYLLSAGTITLGGNLGTGDALQMYWFPALTLSSTTAGTGDTYGSYRNGAAIDNSDPWVLPSDGTSAYTLSFFTIGNGAGEPASVNPASFGYANFTVAAIPEASNLITAGLALGLCAFRFIRGARQK